MTKEYQRGTAVVRPARRAPRAPTRVVRRPLAARIPVMRAPASVVAGPPVMNAPDLNAAAAAAGAAAPPVGAGPPPGMIPGYKKGTASVGKSAHKGHEKIHDNRHVAAAGHFPIQEHAKLHMGRHVTQLKLKEK